MATNAENKEKPEPAKKGGFLSAIANKIFGKGDGDSAVKDAVQKVGKRIVDKIRMIRWEIRVHAMSRCERKVSIKKEEQHSEDLQEKLKAYQKASTMKTLMRKDATPVDAEPHSERTSFSQHSNGNG